MESKGNLEKFLVTSSFFYSSNFYALSIKFDISFTHYFKLTFYALDLQKSKWNEWWISNKAIQRYFNIGGVD